MNCNVERMKHELDLGLEMELQFKDKIPKIVEKSEGKEQVRDRGSRRVMKRPDGELRLSVE